MILDMGMEADHLALADRHIAEGKRRIADQEQLIANLEQDGHDTAAAKSIFATLNTTLQRMQEHRQLILDRLAKDPTG